MLCARNAASLCWGFSNVGIFFFSCNMSKCKHLVQVSGRDSSQVKTTIHIIFCLTTGVRMRSKVFICQLNIHGGEGV